MTAVLLVAFALRVLLPRRRQKRTPHHMEGMYALALATFTDQIRGQLPAPCSRPGSEPRCRSTHSSGGWQR